MLGLNKPNLKQKLFILKNRNAENCKSGTLRDFQTSILLQKYQKIDGGTLWRLLKNFEKMGILNSLIVPKNPYSGTLWDFSTFVLLQKYLKFEDPLGILKFRKKSHQAERGEVS